MHFFNYTFEYEGNAPKLVHTPLTDKCYITLTMGMKMGFGGNPYGPAGTGKTESVKALGQAFGRQVLVFNCDEGIDYQAMGRIFIGIVKSGAWGCFDEFNRLLEEQLSAISQQIQVIQWAIKENQPTVHLIGKNVEVNLNSAIFVTMNPAGKGYGGRSKLPDNLKQLFRPVAMSVPDNEMIAEILLFSEGFVSAKKLSQKIVSLYQLCNQLLSYQQHYDWNLRALKTVLTIGGQLMQEEKRLGHEVSSEIEAIILVKAIRINTFSKLTFSDSNKFTFLLNDMFPNVKQEDIEYMDLKAAAENSINVMKLELIDNQIKKILQFHEALKQRIGVVLVGPSGSGKSTIWNILKSAYEKMGTKVMTYVMNPKSMPRKRLLGFLDNDTREWTDGVLPAAARMAVKEGSEVKCWIICDGDIDPEWVESLNSVLDDNHLLTLPNGERISFGSNINFIFETDNLKFASPATVSRMGVIYLCNEDIDVSRIVKTWLKKLNSENSAKLQTLVEDYFDKCLNIVLEYEEFLPVKTTKVGIVLNALSHIENSMNKSQFAVNIVRGFCCSFSEQLANKIGAELYAILEESPADVRNIMNNTYDSKHGKIITYNYIQNEISSEILSSETPPWILTQGAQKEMDKISTWISSNHPFIIVGPEGAGKWTMVNHLFKNLKSTNIATIHCNASSNSSYLIQKLSQMCTVSSSSQGKVYRPKDASKLIVLLRNLNLPNPDKYDTIQLISFLQQILTYNGFYDENLEFVYLERIQIVATMTPASDIGRHVLSCRLTAIVRISYMELPIDEDLSVIQSQILSIVLSQPSLKDIVPIKSSKKFAEAMTEVLKYVRQKFTSDENRHYIFTPREITKWIFGLLRYFIRDQNNFVEAFAYEGQRIFRDRLVDRESQRKFDSILFNIIKQNFGNCPSLDDVIFVPSKDKSLYRNGSPALESVGKNDFSQIISQAILMYGREFSEIKLHLVDETVDLISQELRILSTEGGSILLAGISGVGRRTCTLLVAFILELNVFTPKITKDYGIKEFHRDLKSLIQSLVIENKKYLLFIEDHQLLKPEFLQNINSLISCWEVGGLYTPEEQEQILSQLHEEFKNQYTYRYILDYFRSKIQKNLRIVVSMDVTNSSFLPQCCSNPALFSTSQVLWHNFFSKQSLISYAGYELKSLLENYESLEGLLSLSQHVYSCCSKLGATPLKFMEMISTYKDIYEKKLKSQTNSSSRLSSGLSKLSEGEKMVEKLLNEVQKSKGELKLKQDEAHAAMDRITVAMTKVSERKVEVEKIQSVLQVENEKILAKKRIIDEELSVIMPEVEEARKRVGQLNADNLREIKTFKMPPEAVYDVLSCVLSLMGTYNTTWNSMKTFLGQSGVIKSILNFDPREITNQGKLIVLKTLQEKPESFEHEKIYRASVAAAPLASWVIAMIKYGEVLEKIQPLENEKNHMESQLQSSIKRLEQCEKELKVLDDEVNKLKHTYEKCTKDAAILEESLRRAEEKLESAQTLISKLSGEKFRWERQMELIKDEVKALPVYSLFSSAFITYLGIANESTREAMLIDWLKPTKISRYNFLNYMSSDNEILKWKREGLAGDQLSIENAVIFQNVCRTPLIIDPSTVAIQWIKIHLKENNIPTENISQQDPKLITQLELSVRFGKTIIIEEVDGVESFLFPLLRKDLIHQGPRWVVNIGEKQVDYSEGFKMLMTSRDPSLEVSNYSKSLISLINFTVTKSGLEGQLLSITLKHEQPELEKKKIAYLENEEKLKIQMYELEDKLLNELTSSGKENILENKLLIESLNETKVKSEVIEKSLEESKKLQESLDEQRNAYRPLAINGANMYMLIAGLKIFNNMYQFSLNSFISLFNKNLDNKPDADNMQKKMQIMILSLLRIIFFNISKSLMKADRLLFGAYFVHGMFPKSFGENEWEFFLGLAVPSMDSTSQLPKWSSQNRKEIYTLYSATFPRLVNLLQLDSEQIWSPWYLSIACENEFPQAMRQKIPPFQKLILVQVFRPDRLESALTHFVCELLEERSIVLPAFSLKRIYEEDSSPSQPILFVLGFGSDPSKELEEFAEAVIGRGRFEQLPMGGGQNETAIIMLKKAAKEGNWLYLKNLHLVNSWLPTLEKELKSLQPHKDFRLWMTTEPHQKFPAILLQSSLKVAYEAPPGIKKNIQRTIQAISSSLQEEGSQVNLFILSWLHAILQERRTYIPQGFTKFYEFSYGDLRAAEGILKELKDQSKSQGQTHWDNIYGLLENAVYGGRIDNDFDIKILRSYLRSFFNSDTVNGSSVISNVLKLNSSTSIKDFISFVNKIPDSDSPELFGLPLNINRSVQRFNSQRIILGLKQLQSASDEDIKYNKETWSTNLGPLYKLWQSLVKIEDLRKCKVRVENLNSKDPIIGFFAMEINNMLILMEKINDFFEGLMQVLGSQGILTSEIEKEAQALLKNCIPSRWLSTWEGPSNPSSYIRLFAKKAFAIRNVWGKGLEDKLFKEGISLSDLFNPGTFLSAFRQKVARSLKVSIDSLKIACSFIEGGLQKAPKIRINGLFIQGCWIENGKLVEMKENSEEVLDIDTCFIGYIPNDSKIADLEGTKEEFPLYSNLSREQVVCRLELPYTGKENDKIISGVALFIEGSEQ